MRERMVLDGAGAVAQRLEFGQLVGHLAPPGDEIHLDEFQRLLQVRIGERGLGIGAEFRRG